MASFIILLISTFLIGATFVLVVVWGGGSIVLGSASNLNRFGLSFCVNELCGLMVSAVVEISCGYKEGGLCGVEVVGDDGGA